MADIKNNKIPENKVKKINISYYIIMFVVIFLIQEFYNRNAIYETLPYSEFKSLLSSGKIKEVVVSDTEVRGVLKEPGPDKKSIVLSTLVEPTLSNEFDKFNVKYSKVPDSTLLKSIFSWVVPTFVFFAVWIYLSRKFMGQAGNSFLNIGKSKAKVFVEKEIKITFNDVAGVDEALEELKEIVAFLKDPVSYGRLGAKMPKGILLVGPPGTGKTLLAKAIAGEAKVPFFSISGSEFVEMFVGVGAARVRDLFEQARSQSPCIIFIDELDALGRARGISPISSGHDEKEQTLNQLLSELDGFDSTTGVILLAATNRPEILDPALLRSGRFDRQVLIDRPDKSGRVDILKVHVKNIKMAKDLKLEDVAALTPGFTGADLANLVNEAALSATRKKREFVLPEDFTMAIERIVAGLEKKSRVLNEKEKKIVAYHEIGHAFVAISLPGSDKVRKVSIIPRGIGALGYTLQSPLEDRYLMTKEELENKIIILLGGRAAEKIFFGNFSTGSSDDIAKVTQVARGIALKYGMVEGLGHISYEDPTEKFLGTSDYFDGHKNYSEKVAEQIDKKIKELVDVAFEKAITIVRNNQVIIDMAAKELLQKETLSEEDLKKYFKLNILYLPKPELTI
ncbi:MAG: ATP-dependent zinc metalloprotease FtsH [Bacteriovorax sp.]|nr:ATP-dependent zinc metalloprotease FtsH [Bacteriovorax sp.]